VATLGAALGYGVMNLLMAATPLAMQVCGFGSAPPRWCSVARDRHVRAGLLHRPPDQALGPLPVMGAGVLLNLACVGMALSGQETAHFGRAVPARRGLEFPVHRQHHAGAYCLPARGKDRAQAPSTSLCLPPWRAPRSPRALVTTSGWNWLNLASLPPLLLATAALLLMARQRGRASAGINTLFCSYKRLIHKR
jgi:hypothetical protein